MTFEGIDHAYAFLSGSKLVRHVLVCDGVSRKKLDRKAQQIRRPTSAASSSNMYFVKLASGPTHTAAETDPAYVQPVMEQLASISQLLRQLLAPGPCQLNLAAELTDLLLDLPLAGQAVADPDDASHATDLLTQNGQAPLPLQVHLHYMRSLMEWLVTLLLRTQQDGGSHKFVC